MRYVHLALWISALLMGTGQLKADLVLNGSFEMPHVTTFGIFTNGNVPGWMSNNNETEIDNSTHSISMPSYDGTQSLELNGNTFDTISQTVSGLTPGQQYLLTWAYGDRPGSGFEQANVFFGGVQVDSDNSNTTAQGVWTAHNDLVVATATSEILSFAAVNTSSMGGIPGSGNEIDGVSLNPTPEPRYLGLMVCGFAGIFLVELRQRRVKQS